MHMKLSLFMMILLVACNSSCNVRNVSKYSVESKHPSVKKEKTENGIWKSAIFKGLKIGTDYREDALKQFGQPQHSGEPKGTENSEIWDDYYNIGGYQGHVIVISAKKDRRILTIAWYPENISLEECKKLFGDDYVYFQRS